MDHFASFLYPHTPMIEQDNLARFFRERLYVLCYAQVAVIMFYAWYVNYSQACL